MKTIIDIDTLKEIQVPDDYICCSVCGKYHPQESYRNTNDICQTRTNCVVCYHLSIEEMETARLRKYSIIRGDAYKNAVNRLTHKNMYFRESMSVRDMIAALSKMNPDDRLVVGQEGYYAQGDIADIFDPEFKEDIDGVKYYTIGFSSQNY